MARYSFVIHGYVDTIKTKPTIVRDALEYEFKDQMPAYIQVPNSDEDTYNKDVYARYSGISVTVKATRD